MVSLRKWSSTLPKCCTFALSIPRVHLQGRPMQHFRCQMRSALEYIFSFHNNAKMLVCILQRTSIFEIDDSFEVILFNIVEWNNRVQWKKVRTQPDCTVEIGQMTKWTSVFFFPIRSFLYTYIYTPSQCSSFWPEVKMAGCVRCIIPLRVSALRAANQAVRRRCGVEPLGPTTGHWTVELTAWSANALLITIVWAEFVLYFFLFF